MNPYNYEDVERLQEIGFYWMQQANRLRAEKKIYSDILLENGINPSLSEIIERLNKMAFEEK